MANPEHLQILKQGVEAWNVWRHQNWDIRPDLHGADLRNASLDGADLRHVRLHMVNLEGASLYGAELEEAIFYGASLDGADLRSANLYAANLGGVSLRGADLSGAYLVRANLGGADLRGADVSEVWLSNTIFGNTNLTDVVGLETCHHEGPSPLDHSTLATSGPLPLAFLRGCGLPDALIEYLPSILGEPFQLYSCFISYSSVDEDFCRRLHGRLQDAGLRVWFAPHDIQGGRKIHEQIDQAIRVYDKLLLVLSPHSMQSPWVEFEMRRARRREVAEQRRLLFPVRLVDYEVIKAWECFDADTAKDLATEIREYYIPDFTAWKEHDAFEAAVARLLRDLKAAERQPKD
jgi:TIR domain-containing protein/pentapeptide repeat protein